jgi:signal peptidase II
MNRSRRLLFILAVMVGCIGCDQATKSLAETHLSYAETLSFLGDTVRLQLSQNHGAFLSFGAALPEAWRHLLFGIGVPILLVALLLYALLSQRLSAVGAFAIALYLAGGASNLADRVARGGYVLDFINLGIGPLRTGIFNIADVFIMAGAVVLAIHEMRQARSPRANA